MISPPSPELAAALADEPPGRALDLACGRGRHAAWLAERGWQVTAVDLEPAIIPNVRFVRCDLERDSYPVEPGGWDLIVCWLYWQANLLPVIMAGVRQGGVVALAGKTTGRFETSLANYRSAFPGWQELASGEADGRAWFIARRSR